MINNIIYGRQKEIFKTFVNSILDIKYLLWLFLMWKLKSMFFEAFARPADTLEHYIQYTYFPDIFSFLHEPEML